MPNKNAERGKRVERYIVDRAEKRGIEAMRAWGSDGRSMGLDREVDVVLGPKPITVQVKMREKLAKYLYPPKHVDVTIVKTDRREPLVIMPLEMFLDLLSGQ